jgi:hypothetical protein
MAASEPTTRALAALYEFFAPGGILARCPQEANMHIHGNQMNLNAGNPYAGAAEKAVAAQRAAGVRNKLMMSAKDIEGISNPEEASMVSKWMDSGQSRAPVGVEYHTAASGKDSDFG